MDLVFAATTLAHTYARIHTEMIPETFEGSELYDLKDRICLYQSVLWCSRMTRDELASDGINGAGILRR
jgi:hypothetical protein